MPEISFLFDCTTVDPSIVTEIHPFGPSLDGFNSDLGLRIDTPESFQILAITHGRLFTAGNDLLLQPFILNAARGRHDEPSEVGEIFSALFAQPFVLCYKNIEVREELLRSHIENVADRRGEEIDSIWDEISEKFMSGEESIGVNPGEWIGTLRDDTMGFEIFYIPNGIMETMYGEVSGLNIIRQHFSNSVSRRLDPLFFFMSIPDAERINYRKTSEQIEHAIFARFTRRILLEIRDEYDKYFVGEYPVGGETKSFTEESHGMVTLLDAAPGVDPAAINYEFDDDYHFFTLLPSGISPSRRVTRSNILAPYHHATQRIYMHASDNERNWYVQNTLSWYTENNRVEYLIDGRSTFRRMVEELNKIDSGDHYVRLAGWWLQSDFNLVPGETIESIFSRIDSVGASIHAIIWSNIGDLLGRCSNAIGFINQLTNGRGILDNNDTHFHGSQHQKILIIKNREGIVGFCGGVDINSDRLDDQSHQNPADRDHPYHDTHALIRGPAVSELDLTIVHRWNAHVEWFNSVISRNPDLRINPGDRRVMRREAHTGGFTAPHFARYNYTDYHYDPGPRISVSSSTEYEVTSARASAFIQVTRTFAQSHASRFYPFQPHGEVGTLNALKKAISKAKKYIYIEDQYLYPYGGELPNESGIENITDVIAQNALSSDHVGILRALYNKLSDNSELVLILITSGPNKYQGIRLGELEIDTTSLGMRRLRFFIKMLRYARRALSGRDKIKLCYPRHYAREVYVHSKLWIIDDVYLKLGSANCGRRSLTHDSETDIHIIDGALLNGHRRFARSYRKALWKEHLGIDSDERLDDIDYSLYLWQNLGDLATKHVEEYTYTTTGFIDPPMGAALAWNNLVDPEGRLNPPNNPRITPPDPSYD